jgi:tetratricopeptide (TPR) repeat protein
LSSLRILTVASHLVAIIWLVCLCPGYLCSQTSDDYARGLAAFRGGDYVSAADFFAKAEAAAPAATNALVYQAKALVNLQNFPGAESALRHYLATSPNSDEALYLLGFVLHRENKPQESLEIFTRAAALKTPTADDLKIVGLDYVLLNDYTDAIKWLEKAVQFDPKNKDAWYYLGRAYYSDSRLPQAKKAFITALELDPHDAKTEDSMGLVLEAEGKTDEALDAFRKSIAWWEQSAHPSEQPYLNLGSLLLDQQKTDEALPSLKKAVELAPNNGNCHLKLGVAYLRMNRLPDALLELERAVQLEPENAAMHYELGRLYRQNHQMDRAEAEFARTEELLSHAATDKVESPPKP